MAKKKIKMAVCYDFDGTLSPQYMQNVGFLPKLGITPADFWAEVKALAERQNMDETLAYMNLMIDKAKEKKIALTAKFLMGCGKNIQFFPGVDTWFDRIKSYAKTKNIDLEHYIITSGNEEIIRGTSIKKHFKYIFACKFAYDRVYNNDLIAQKPAAAVNYTNKTQHLFRINKGVFNYWQNAEVNKYTPKEEKYVDFKNMVYIGDGETDVPCMKMVMSQGGHAIAVYNPDTKSVKEKRNKAGEITRSARPSAQEVALDLFNHGRVNFIAPTDYEKDSKLEQILKNIIDRIYLEQVSV